MTEIPPTEDTVKQLAKQLADRTFPQGNFRRAILEREATKTIRAALSASAPPGWRDFIREVWEVGSIWIDTDKHPELVKLARKSHKLLSDTPASTPPADFELCHCELTSEVHVIRVGERGCELCNPAERIKPDADAVEGVLRGYQHRVSVAQAEIIESRRQWKNYEALARDLGKVLERDLEKKLDKAETEIASLRKRVEK